MVFEEWELNLIIDSLEESKGSKGNMLKGIVVDKIKNIQSNSRNKRYSLRSTDWLSEAAKKNKGKKKIDKINEGALI